MEEELEHLQNIHVSAIEQNGQVVFLHKIKEGPTDKSYGIHVAKLAELPTELINRANEILATLENQEKNIKGIFQKNTDIMVQKDHSFIAKNEKMEQVEDAIINVHTAKDHSFVSEVDEAQLSFFEEESTQTKKTQHTTKEKRVLEKIKELDILDMTPMQAMNILYELHKKMKS